MFSLNGNGIVILVSLEIYHRMGSVQTRQSMKQGEQAVLVLPLRGQHFVNQYERASDVKLNHRTSTV